MMSSAIKPMLVEICKAKARDTGVADNAEFQGQHFFKTERAPATG
jgi:hypothetical protein